MKWIYPYKVLFGDVTMRITQAFIDDDPLPDQLVDEDRREIQLVDADLERSSWATAELEIELRGPKSELAEFSHNGAAPTATAVLHSGPANTRQGFELMQDERDSAVWRGRIELDRSVWFGRISVRGTLSATVEGADYRVIGSAPEWILRLDDLPRPPVHGAIQITWDDFSDPKELSALSRYEAEPAFLHLDPDEPVLYLNRSFDGLEALLRDRRGRNAPEQALHDQTRVTIATEAWTAMFNAGLLAIRDEPDDGEVDWPESEWQRTVLEILIDRMYPDKSASDALDELAAARQEGAGALAVQQLVLPAVSAHVGVPKLLRSSIRLLGYESSETGEA